MAEADAAGEILFLHAGTLYESARTPTPLARSGSARPRRRCQGHRLILVRLVTPGRSWEGSISRLIYIADNRGQPDFPAKILAGSTPIRM
jgi:hypothetical protein